MSSRRDARATDMFLPRKHGRIPQGGSAMMRDNGISLFPPPAARKLSISAAAQTNATLLVSRRTCPSSHSSQKQTSHSSHALVSANWNIRSTVFIRETSNIVYRHPRKSSQVRQDSFVTDTFCSANPSAPSLLRHASSSQQCRGRIRPLLLARCCSPRLVRVSPSQGWQQRRGLRKG